MGSSLNDLRWWAGGKEGDWTVSELTCTFVRGKHDDAINRFPPNLAHASQID